MSRKMRVGLPKKEKRYPLAITTNIPLARELCFELGLADEEAGSLVGAPIAVPVTPATPVTMVYL